jgi:hypothetical protein
MTSYNSLGRGGPRNDDLTSGMRWGYVRPLTGPVKVPQQARELAGNPVADLLTTANTERWMDQALCAGNLDDALFPNKLLTWQERVAIKQLCAKCPVRRECLDYAQSLADTGETVDGIWGGVLGKTLKPATPPRKRPNRKRLGP